MDLAGKIYTTGSIYIHAIILHWRKKWDWIIVYCVSSLKMLFFRELCLMLCDSLDGKGVWGRVDTCTYVWLSRSAMYPTLDNIFNRLYILQYKINHFKKQQQQGSLSYTFITHSTRVFFKRWATYEFDHEPCKTLASAVPIHTHLPLSPPQPLEAIKPGLCALVFAALVAFTVPVSWPHVYLVVSCFRIN